MKTKRLMILVGMLVMVSFFATSVYAASRFRVCSVEQAGPAGNGTFIQLRVVSTGAAYWCYPKPGREKEMLAVALTAAANNMTVNANFDDRLKNPIIGSLYLIP